MRKQSAGLPALLLAAAVLLGGCSPQSDISKRSIVTMTAVTLEKDGSCRVAVESLSRLGSEEKTWESHTGRGSTFAQALTDMELTTGKSLYLDGCKVLLLDGFSDREELLELLGEIDAHGGIRPLTLVAVCRELPGLLEGLSEEESLGEELFSLLTGGELSQVNLKDCICLLDTPGRGLLLPMVGKQEEVRVKGYLSPGRSVLLETPAETGHLLPFAKPRADRDRVYTVTGEGYSADWVLEKMSKKIRPRVENGAVTFLLEARAEGYLLSGKGELDRRELLCRAQDDICRELLEEYGYVLEKISKPSGNDLFSLGKHLELFRGETWQEIGADWEERLPEIPVELRGSVLLRDKKRLSDRG